MLRRIGLIAAAFAALMLVVSPAAAQYDHKKKNNPQPTAPAGPPAVKAGPQGVVCVPSGFARLSRNCNANTGACQPMRDQCNLGWCCP